MRLILAILICFASSADAGGPGKRSARLRSKHRHGTAAIQRCARLITGEEMVKQLAESPAFIALEKPNQVEGIRHLKLLVAKMSNGSFEVAYGPLTMGNFLVPAIRKLHDVYLEKAILADNETLLDEATDPIQALWVGEVEIEDGAIVRAAFRDLRDRRNEPSVMGEFMKHQRFPWAFSPSFKLTRLRPTDFHLEPFMNPPEAREYSDFYEFVGDGVSSISRSLLQVEHCVDQGDLESARDHFKATAGLTRTAVGGAIIQFEVLAREDGFRYENERDQNRFQALAAQAAVNPEHVTAEDIRFFRQAINQLSALVNLSRPTLQLHPDQMFPLIYILNEHAVGEVYPFGPPPSVR